MQIGAGYSFVYTVYTLLRVSDGFYRGWRRGGGVCE